MGFWLGKRREALGEGCAVSGSRRRRYLKGAGENPRLGCHLGWMEEKEGEEGGQSLGQGAGVAEEGTFLDSAA